MTRVLVTVIGPNGRHHLWLPPRVPLRDLLPAILQATAVDGSAPWRLRPKGGPPLHPDATLADAGVLQGAVLLLQPEAGDGARPGSRVVPPPRSSAPEVRAEAAREEAVELVVRGGPGAGRRARLEPGEHRLGSRGETPVALDDPCLAPVHLVVRVGPDGEVTVVPARPELVVALDGVRLSEPRPVAPGERLTLGHSLLSLERPGRPAPERRDLDSVPRLRVPAPPARSGPVGALAAVLGLAAAGLGLGGEGGPALALGLLATGLGGWLGGGWWRFGQARRRFRERLDGLHRDLNAARRARLERLDAAAPDAPRLLADLVRGGAISRAGCGSGWAGPTSPRACARWSSRAVPLTCGRRRRCWRHGTRCCRAPRSRSPFPGRARSACAATAWPCSAWRGGWPSRSRSSTAPRT